ncbi:MAG: GMC family oxidoreductase [Acetobacter sp.]|uniref:GMC family oxidoreductase n=1 Tax=Acetobacter sp. TaxID=440 RepID=UPI0039E9F5B8
MTVTLKPVDAVVIGLGWTGSILSMELANEGLNVVALERGAYRDTAPDWTYPKAVDELKYGIRGDLFQRLSKDTVTIRHAVGDTAVPYRQLNVFLLPDNVGGAGMHWNGQHYRPSPEDLKFRTRNVERYGAKFLPEDMTIQDYDVTYDELEPYLDEFEQLCGTSGQAGNIRGTLIPGGNPFEGPRSRGYPTPALPDSEGARRFAIAAREMGYSPFPQPAANCSQSWTNQYGVRLGPCNLCGYCERYGCYIYAKASPQTTILPALLRKLNFEMRTHSNVTKINLSSDGKRATGVTYVDAAGQEVIQPADLVILSSFQINNVRLMLLSGIGKPYDPNTGEGVIGKNFAYQMMSESALFFDKDVATNPFIGAGAGAQQIIDEFNADHFDHAPHGFIGGGYILGGTTGGRPLQQLNVPPGTPAWGAAWKKAAKDTYLHSTRVQTHSSVMSYRGAYVDLDPTYRNALGQPLARITFDWHDNEYRMTRFVTDRALEIVAKMNPKSHTVTMRKPGDHFNTRQYQTTHITGGVITGADPKTSAVNRYSQSWDVPNLFVFGASAFPQNFGYNPTGLIGGLTYMGAHAIRDRYLKSPGPLVPV